MMQWEQLLSLKRQGDTGKRLRKEQDPTRLGFEVDYDRIIFSPYFRSLQDKTQVIPLSKTDFVHTRLTHSLEVSVVGHSLGRLAGSRLLERHPHLAAVCESVEGTLGFRLTGDREREGKAAKARFAGTEAVGGQQGRVPYANDRVHHLLI